MKQPIKTLLRSPKSACVAAIVAAALAAGGLLLNQPEPATQPGSAKKVTASLKAKKQPEPQKENRPMTPGQRAAALAKLGPEAVGELGERLLNAKTLEEKKMFADALALIGNHDAVEQLLANAVLETDPAAKIAIARGLSALSNREGIDSLVTALAATDERPIQNEVAGNIGRLADGSTVATLAQLYREDPAFRTQRPAIRRAIASIGNESAVRSLAELARVAPEPGLVEAAARGLAKIGSAGAVTGLLDSLERVADNDASLRAALLDQLTRVQNPEGIAVLAQLDGSELPDDLKTAVNKIRSIN